MKNFSSISEVHIWAAENNFSYVSIAGQVSAFRAEVEFY
jgi:hypothetical protein